MKAPDVVTADIFAILANFHARLELEYGCSYRSLTWVASELS